MAGARVHAARADKRPNIVLIMGDDIGWSDIGCFGSEIETPNLDKIGMGGVRFAQGYNMAKCNPTRSSMMTGTFLGSKSSSQSLGGLMTQAGYTTLTSGKEHYDSWVPNRCKAMNSFDKSFTHYGGAGPFFSHNAITFHLDERKLEHSEVEANTSKPYYKTNAITDYALRFLDETKGDEKPFFLYVAYESAHYPLHALKEDFAKFSGRYKVGWDVIRQKRFEKQKRLGMIPKDTRLSPAHALKPHVYLPWDQVPEEEKQDLDDQMAGFAAMVHCLDRNVGRLVTKLKELDQYENTLIVYLSDNGSCPFERNKNQLHPTDPTSYRSLDSPWSNVGNTPFRLYKQNGHEGGSRTHMMAHWPAVIKPGMICHEPTHLVDFMPTFLELAKGTYPKQCEGEPTPVLDGRSLVPLFQGKSRPPHPIILTGWTEKKRMIRSGDWVAVTVDGNWELYDIEKDPTQLDDLAEAMPEKMKQLQDLYAKYRADRPYLKSGKQKVAK